MANIQKVEPGKLPQLKDLYKDVSKAFNEDQLLMLLNQPPHEPWIKKHPFIANYRYLPIDKVEYLLKRIFKRYRIEVLKSGMLLNAVEVTVRVWYQHPVTGEMEYHDGVGAQELQTQKDSGVLKADMSNLNKGAVMMALPIAKSMAIKDACDHFGTLFGSDLNRKDTAVYTPNIKPEDVAAKKEYERLVALIERATSKEELDELVPHITPETSELWEQKANFLK